MHALLLTVALAAAPPASPDQTPAQAKQAFNLAKQLYAQRRYAEAVVKFEEGYALFAQPVILYNIGKCHERLGATALALRSFRDYQRLWPAAAKDDTLKGDIANCERRLRESGLQQLLVFAEPVTARLAVDGQALSPSPAYVELRGGPHTLSASAEGYEPEERHFVTSLQRVAELTVNLRPMQAAPVAAADAPLQPGAPSLTPAPQLVAQLELVQRQPPPSSRHLGTWIGAGVAVAAAATAVGLGLAANSAAADMNTSDPNRTRAQADALAASVHDRSLGADIAWGVAGAAAATAVVLFFVEREVK
jgi:hypothetical protein